MDTKQLYLIDATAFCYRAFHALKDLSTSFGQPTNAIYGFTNILNKLLKSGKPDYLAACFDVSRDTFRAKKFAEYKIQRPAMPDELSSQIPFIKEIIRAYGITIFEKEGFEADDLIATLAVKARRKNIAVTVVSSDKDILQLVDEHTKVFSPYKDEGVIYDRNAVFQRYGVEPKKITDIIALMGDDADNIPGVPGVGEKTAAELIKDFGTVERLLKNAGDIAQEKLRAAVLGNKERILLNKELAMLRSDVDIEFDPETLKKRQPDNDALFKLFKYLEFKRMLKTLPSHEEPEVSPEIEEIGDAGVKDKVASASKLYLFGEHPDSLVFCAGAEYFRVKPAGENLKNILADAGIKKVGYDLKKIKVNLGHEGVMLDGLSHDVMLAAYLLNPSRTSYSLQDIAWDYLEKSEPALIDSQRALNRILDLEPVLEKELKDKELFKLFTDIEMPLASVLAVMELNGVTIDKDLLKDVSRDVEKKLIKLIEQIYNESGTQFNINSPKQLREILFEKLKLPVVKKSKTGPSTDEEVLRKLSGKHPLPALLLDYRQLMKLKTTYIDTLPKLIDKKTGKIHSSFNQTGTETGRLSSSNPNLQNIPVKSDAGGRIRQAIVASGKNNRLISCDYSQIELRILAHLSKDAHLISAFKNDKDIHRATASLIWGVEEKDIEDSMREAAKRVNFGIVYGLTSYGLSRDLNIPVDEAQSFIDAYFIRYPAVKDYIQAQIAFCRKHGFVTTILGRRRYIPEISSKNQGIRQFAERQAINTPIQGSASDLIKLAMIDIHKGLISSRMESMMVMQIHDELVFDAREKESEDLIRLVRERMEHVLELDVPIRVDIKKGKNWLEMESVV